MTAPDRRFNPAMTITYLRFLLAPLFVVTYVHATTLGYALAFGVIVLGMLSDFLDGYLARKRNQVSDLGKALDPLGDVAFFQVVYACMAVMAPYWVPWWALAVLLGRELIQYAVIRTIATTRGFVLQAQFSGKLKTALACVAMLAACALDIARSAGLGAGEWEWPSIVEVGGSILFGIVAATSAASLFEYAIALKRMSRERAATPDDAADATSITE